MVALQPAAPTFLAKSPLAAVSELGTTRCHYRCTHTHSVQSQHPFPSSNPAAIPSMVARIPQCGHSAAASPARRMQHYTTQTDTTVRPPVSRHPRPGSRIIGDGQQAVGSGGGGCWIGVLGCWDVLGRCGLGDAVRIGGELILPVHADTCWRGTMLPKPNEKRRARYGIAPEETTPRQSSRSSSPSLSYLTPGQNDLFSRTRPPESTSFLAGDLPPQPNPLCSTRPRRRCLLPMIPIPCPVMPMPYYTIDIAPTYEAYTRCNMAQFASPAPPADVPGRGSGPEIDLSALALTVIIVSIGPLTTYASVVMTRPHTSTHTAEEEKDGGTIASRSDKEVASLHLAVPDLHSPSSNMAVPDCFRTYAMMARARPAGGLNGISLVLMPVPSANVLGPSSTEEPTDSRSGPPNACPTPNSPHRPAAPIPIPREPPAAGDGPTPSAHGCPPTTLRHSRGVDPAFKLR
ncbi:hypothetical protein OIDMADRAFT_25353 [Oidiodendron maius Zn]|uniref:Uncharacterized protein n=1 Tax=Oidiodendron maius (strain Zn) TaxID=913774 RepID=A0A0C3D0F7_OIDMZ|nr:hypothetical protein OIDMADRAFT_25353 [Oidiodendron maius Zn]